jgi:uncharacterized protein (DUF342 family)
MEIDPEIQNLIDEYVEQIESKEEDLTGLKRNIDGIISFARQELSRATSALDKKFDNNEISEEEYLTEFRAQKEDILKKTKEKLNSLLVRYEKIYSTLDS